MRSLALLSTSLHNLKNSNITQQSVDAEHETVYLCSEVVSDSSCDIDILKVDRNSADEPTPIATFPIAANSEKDSSQIISFRFLGENQSLALITSSGDIGSISVEEDSTYEFDIVGSIEAGIKAATWNPDESLVALITGENRILLMTNTFDTISESALETTEEGEDQQVNVGWGSKTTQFHGSLGKAAAQEGSVQLDKIGLSPDDDLQPRISWRGDGTYVVVSFVSNSGPRQRRSLRVYDRQGVLQNVSEPIAGLEHVLSWRPSGNLIASTQRFGFEGGGAGKTGRHDLIFFERNGLRHGEFGLREAAAENTSNSRRWGYKVKDLFWNCDSNILAIWIERDNEDIIQLWTIGNYHWYLKQEIVADADCPRFSSASWHPEKPMILLLTSSSRIFEYQFTWETFISRAPPPNDSGCVAVVDGTNVLLTPFRTQNVPPPMSSCQLALTTDNNHTQQARTPLHVSFSSSRDTLAVLHQQGLVRLYDLRTRLEPGRGKAVDPSKICEISLTDTLSKGSRARQCILTGQKQDLDILHVAVLASDSEGDYILHANVTQSESSPPKIVRLPSASGRLLYSSYRIFWQSISGEIFEVYDDDDYISPPLCQFPEFSVTTEAVELNDNDVLFIARADSGNLYAAMPSSTTAHKLASGTTSFVISGEFVIYTVVSHEAFFAPLKSVQALLYDLKGEGSSVSNKDIDNASQWERRRVERGSVIVTSVSSAMSLVLQMPRGNLETINPRPLVLAVVRQDIDVMKYRKAFIACRKHRIDLNVLFAHNPTSFMGNVASFVEQIEDVDFLNLFLTNIGQSTLPPTTIAEICDAIRTQLETKDLTKYVNSILTAHVSKKPADYEAGLKLLLRLRDIDSNLVEEAVKYIIFLVDADKLFDTALGMYDFSLVLLIAQHSQKDPREYLPFLRELRALPKYYQRYKIDDHLKRYQSALRNIRLAGSDYLEEALKYIELHHLYLDSLAIWRNDPESYLRLLELYGDWLFDRREYDKAAIVYVEARKHPKAIVAYERALMWRELFTLAVEDSVDENEIEQIALRVADELSSKKRFDEAARVLIDYGKDVRGCVQALAHGNSFSEARRIISVHREAELIVDILHPAALESRHQFTEDIDEMKTQLGKQVQRIQELRVKQVKEPDAFYGVEEENLHNVDVMTDVSMAPTAFTRYTAAPSMASKASKRSSRSKRKLERKVGSGKKGTVDEEEYLLTSITKLVTRFKTLESDAERLIPHLMVFSDEHRAEAKDLQAEILDFRKEIELSIDIVWPSKTEQDEDGELASFGGNWASMIEGRIAKRRFAVEQIVKPTLSSSDWKNHLLDL
ncbi:IkappaB kinase complex, IKAP component [Schizopora paradoxa]|uniref:Elongator complex protein 1 n=1 Tax=Schizopora paradoxa TaxID=27342 RepID=A0A0H2RY33_9AGAM|nr:IkappaB kinase complex, IKAP component [Schizopora paradoxa]